MYSQHSLLQLHSMLIFRSGTLLMWRTCFKVRPLRPLLLPLQLLFVHLPPCFLLILFTFHFYFFGFIFDNWQLATPTQRSFMLMHSTRTFQSGTLLWWRPCKTVRPLHFFYSTCSCILFLVSFNWILFSNNSARPHFLLFFFLSSSILRQWIQPNIVWRCLVVFDGFKECIY